MRGWARHRRGAGSVGKDELEGPLSELRAQLVEAVRRGLREFDQPVRLASGDWSRHFIDVKYALADGADAALAARAVIELLKQEAIGFDAVGGLTMGADVLAHGVAMTVGKGVEWFSVRKQAKDRGTQQRIEGARLTAGRRVLLVDDVVTRGGSILDALGAIRDTGANVTCAVTLVDRGDFGRELFRAEGVPYHALIGYADLGIPPVGSEPGVTTATG